MHIKIGSCFISQEPWNQWRDKINRGVWTIVNFIQKWCDCIPPICSQAITRSGSYWMLILHTVNTSKHQFNHCKDAICLNEATPQPAKPSWHSREAQNAANPLLDSHINISQWLHRIPITPVNTAQLAYFISSAAERAGQSYHRSVVVLCYIIKMSTGPQSGEKTHKSTADTPRGFTWLTAALLL